jgi:hypothetical protein
MAKKKPKKPTLNEVKGVVENLIHDLTLVNNKVDSLGMVFQSYIEYKKEDDKFLEHLKKVKEQDEAKQRTSDESSK